MKNKKMIIALSAVGVILIIVLVLLFGKTKSNESYLSNEEVNKKIDNTINLDSFKVTYAQQDVGFDNKVEKYSVVYDKKSPDGLVIYDQKEEAYSLNGVEILEYDRFSFKDHEDNFFHYYPGCNIVSGNAIDTPASLFEVLKELKNLTFEYKDDQYMYDVETNSVVQENKVWSGNLLRYIGLVVNDNYIETIIYHYYFDDDKEIAEMDNFYNFSEYNNVSISIPDEIKTSLAHNLYDMISYGEDNESWDKSNRNGNNFFDSSEKCSNGKSKTTFEIRNYNGFFYSNITKQDCSTQTYYSGQTYESDILKELFIKNTTTNHSLDADHSNDIYVMYDKKTFAEVGRFKYNEKNNTIDVTSGDYKGIYTLRTK